MYTLVLVPEAGLAVLSVCSSRLLFACPLSDLSDLYAIFGLYVYVFWFFFYDMLATIVFSRGIRRDAIHHIF